MSVKDCLPCLNTGKEPFGVQNGLFFFLTVTEAPENFTNA